MVEEVGNERPEAATGLPFIADRFALPSLSMLLPLKEFLPDELRRFLDFPDTLLVEERPDGPVPGMYLRATRQE